jgi:hypothetical protein
MRAFLKTDNYEVVFDGNQLKSTNLNTREVFSEGYFLSIKTEDAFNHDFNLLLNTWDLLNDVSRKGMTKEMKTRLRVLEDHVSNLVDIHMGRA